MNKKILAASLLSLASTAVTANPIFDVYAGASYWNQNYDGFVRDLDATANTEIDLENDLGFDDDDGNVFYVAFEHPIPLIPNIRLQQTSLETDANGSVSQNFEFNGEMFSISDDVASSIDLSHTDATFYWEILDNYVSLDIGLTARMIDGEVSIESTTQSAKEDFDAVIPLIYAGARVDLPLTGLYASISGNFLGDGDNSFLDYQASIGYETVFRLGVEAGIRSLQLELDDIDDVQADITVDGAFIGLFIHL